MGTKVLLALMIYMLVLATASFGAIVLSMILVPLFGALFGLVISITPIGPFVCYGASLLGLTIVPSDLPPLFSFIGMVAALVQARVTVTSKTTPTKE